MTDYSKLNVSLVYSENSDYTDPQVVSTLDAYEATPTQIQRFRVSAATGGTAIDLAAITTVSAIIIKNTDSTNYVTISHNNAANSAQSRVLSAGKIDVTGDYRIANDLTLTANTSACVCDVYIIGT